MAIYGRRRERFCSRRRIVWGSDWRYPIARERKLRLGDPGRAVVRRSSGDEQPVRRFREPARPGLCLDRKDTAAKERILSPARRWKYTAFFLLRKSLFRFVADALSELLHGLCIAVSANAVMILFKSEDRVNCAKAHQIAKLCLFIFAKYDFLTSPFLTNS